MRKGFFYLNSQILSIYSGDDAKGHVYVPEGAIISADPEALKEDHLIEVYWNGQRLQMFAQDIRQRADRVNVASASQSAA